MKLLIVDDHEINLKLLRVQLETEGHSVVEAENGVQALEVLERERVDGVISDILMPRMDGYRLCLEVRKSQNYGQIPFVLYTSTYNSPGDQQLAETAGADAYIQKPAPTKKILEALQSASTNLRARATGHAVAELEAPVLKQYNEALVHKLEEKSLELERTYDGLVQVEARLSGLVETAIDGIIAIDEAHRIILFNAAAGKMFGCEPGQALDRPLNDFIPTRSRGTHSAEIESFARAEVPTRQMGARSVSALRCDGTEFPIEASISKMETSRGAVYTVFIRDITERRRAESQIERAVQRLNEAQRIGQIGDWEIDLATQLVTWSPQVFEIFGRDPRLGPPKDLEEVAAMYDADSAARLHHHVARAIETSQSQDYELLALLPDGGQAHLQARAMPKKDDNGKVVGLYGTVQDISKRKQAEARIERLNRLYMVLSGINTLIVRAQDRDELFREACRIAVDAGKFSNAWIGVMENGRICVPLAAWAGLAERYREQIVELLRQPVIPTHGMQAVATEAKVVIVNDVATDARISLRDEALASGVRSLVVLPLSVSGKIVALFTLCADQIGVFDDDEMKLLLELASDISFALDHLAKAEQISYLANYDALTGLPNRNLFVARLSERIKATNGGGAMLAVALVDLERFRRINETLGRAAGDEILKLVASRLNQAQPSAARLGADVFAFKIIDRNSVAEVARALQEVFAGCFDEPFSVDGHELRIGCRGGIAVYPSDGEDAETLLRNAEAALRQARSSAQHCVFYAPKMNAQAAEALKIESKLRRAIERHEFVLFYQPKVSFVDRRICSVEALIRWQDPEQGLVPPLKFISVLEESGLIGVVGHWALGQALANQRRWRAAGFAPLRVAVNVSPLQLQQPDFAAQIGALVGEDGGEALELEITESVIMENVERNVAMLKEIRGHGVSIAIDDFGTGYSSLAYIAKLPITSLKIDRAFITGMTEGPEGWTLVSSIVALAHALKLKVVAEGVETEQQAHLLHLLACDEAQGYLFSRPVPAAEIEAMLQAGGTLPATKSG